MILNDATAQENMRREWAQPLPPESPTFSGWAGLSSGLKGAGLELGANMADLRALSLSGPGEFQKGIDPLGKTQETQKALNAWANATRSKAEPASPEAMHKADQVIGGLVRGITTAVGEVAVLGPVGGALAFGMGEGNTATKRLEEKGIDPATALKVGAVTGAISGLSVAIPGVGPTVAKTIGLGLAGGPAAYVSQETLVRDILKRAAYNDEASLHNPTDPLGLALSTLIPLAVGGVHIRSLKRLENLSKQSSLKDAARLTPDEQKASDAYERSAANIKELQAAVAAEKNPESRAVLQTELDKQTTLAQRHAYDDATARGAADPAVVDAARVRVTDDALMRSLPDHPEARAEVAKAVDEVASGRIPEVQEPTITVWHGSPHKFNQFDSSKIGTGEGAQAFGQGLYLADSRAVAQTYQSTAPYVGRQVQQIGLDALKQADGDIASARALLAEKYSANKDPYLRQPIADAVNNIEDIAKGTVGGNLYKIQLPARLVPNMLDWDKPLSEQAPQVKSALSSLGADVTSATKAGDWYNDAAQKLAPGNFMAARPEVTEQLRAAGIPGIRYLDSGSRTTGNGTSNYVLFPGEEAALKIGERNGVAIGRDISPPVDVGPNKPIADGDSTPSHEAQLVQQVLAETPNLKVKLPGSDETLTAEVALARAKEEAKYEAGEADLVRAALDCVLLNG